MAERVVERVLAGPVGALANAPKVRVVSSQTRVEHRYSYSLPLNKKSYPTINKYTPVQLTTTRLGRRLPTGTQAVPSISKPDNFINIPRLSPLCREQTNEIEHSKLVSKNTDYRYFHDQRITFVGQLQRNEICLHLDLTFLFP